MLVVFVLQVLHKHVPAVLTTDTRRRQKLPPLTLLDIINMDNKTIKKLLSGGMSLGKTIETDGYSIRLQLVPPEQPASVTCYL